MRFCHLVWFHLKNYCRNSYFVTVMLSSTLTLFLLQYIAVTAQQQTLSELMWLRTGIFGLWSSGTTAAGIIGMQRWQGTLLYLINNPVSDYQSLAAVVIPASLFGLLSFPVAYALAFLFQVPAYFSLWHVLYILLFWLGAVVLDLLIAAFFVLTRHAIVYEELITLPILLLSGLFSLPSNMSLIKQIGQFIVPIAMPIQWLLQEETLNLVSFSKFLCSLVLFICISRQLVKYLIQKAQQTGQIGGGL